MNFLENLRVWIAQFEQNLNAISFSLNEFADNLCRVLQKVDTDKLSAFKESVRSFIEEQECLKQVYEGVTETLTNHGWYVGGDIPATLYLELAKAVVEQTNDETDRIMSEFMGTRFDIILGRVKERYPERRSIIEDAFAAHRQGKVTLSVPVFLAQADGIWHQAFESVFFTKDRKDKLTKGIAAGNWNESLSRS